MTEQGPMQESPQQYSVVTSAEEVLTGGSKKNLLARLMPFLGPAFIAAVAYVDPGNFATNIQGGSQFGYSLVWVILASNLMAMLVQAMSAKLGIATGRNLAELCREMFPRRVVWVMWVLMELVAISTDLAEFLGAALGFYMLFGTPLWIAGLLTAAITFLILGLERKGFRPLEAVITSFVGVISIAYLIETFLDKPDWGQIGLAIIRPTFQGPESILLATGILGATVMPHAIFLHSALTQGRVVVNSPQKKRQLFRYEIADVVIAMGVASAVNAAMLIMAASTFFRAGMTHVATIEQAHLTLEPLLGPAASIVFAISLLASGLSSTSVGTMAGQVIMQGFLHFHIPVWIRRLVTIFPSMIVILIGLEPTRVLVISQVVLSFGLPFAIIPLLLFTRNKKLMGPLVNKSITTVALGIVAAIILVLNFYLLYATFKG